MPKLSKKKRDAIIERLKQGYTQVEIAEELEVSRNTVGKIKKEISAKKTPTQEDPNTLSNKSLEKLRNIQGLLGKKSLIETIDVIFDDYTTIMPLKYKYDLNFTKTPGEVFKEVAEKYEFNEKGLTNVLRGKGNNWIQTMVLRSWGMGWTVRILYDIIRSSTNFQGSIVDFMENIVLNKFVELGWKIEMYYNTEYQDNYPVLTNPSGIRTVFPIE